MKKFLLLAALIIAPAVVAGCSCGRSEVRQVCPPQYVRPACPPAVQPVAVAPAPRPVAQPACPPVQVYAIPQTAACPPAVSGRVTYAQPIQVSGAGTVLYYNPYVQPRVVR